MPHKSHTQDFRAVQFPFCPASYCFVVAAIAVALIIVHSLLHTENMVVKRLEGGGLLSALPASQQHMRRVEGWMPCFSVGPRPCHCCRGTVSTSGERGSEGTVHWPIFHQVVLSHELEFTVSLGCL